MANTAVMSGDVQHSFATLPAALPQVKAGTLDAPAVTAKTRSSEWSTTIKRLNIHVN